MSSRLELLAQACAAALVMGSGEVARVQAQGQPTLPVFIATSPGCATPESLLESLDEPLRAQVRLVRSEDAQVRLAFERDPNGWTVVSERVVQGTWMRRTLALPIEDCAALDAPMRFVLTMIIEHWAQEPEPTPHPPPSAPTEPDAVALRTPPPQPVSLERRAGGVSGARVSLGLGAILRAAPGRPIPTTSVHVELGIVRSALARFFVRAHVTWPFTISTGAGTGARVVATGADVLWCPEVLREGRLGVTACAGAAGSLDRAQGMGFDVNVTSWAAGLEVLGAARTEINLSERWALAFGVELGISLLSPRYFVADSADTTLQTTAATPGHFLQG